jgi:hypothetical protein
LLVVSERKIFLEDFGLQVNIQIYERNIYNYTQVTTVDESSIAKRAGVFEGEKPDVKLEIEYYLCQW